MFRKYKEEQAYDSHLVKIFTCTDADAKITKIETTNGDPRYVYLKLTFKNDFHLMEFFKLCPDRIQKLPKTKEFVEAGFTDEQLSDASMPQNVFLRICAQVYRKHGTGLDELEVQREENRGGRFHVAVGLNWAIKDLLCTIYKFDNIDPEFICRLLYLSTCHHYSLKKDDLFELIATNHFPLAFEIAKSPYFRSRDWLCSMGEHFAALPDPEDETKCHPLASECYLAAQDDKIDDKIRCEAMLNYNVMMFAVDCNRDKFQRFMRGEELVEIEQEQQEYLFKFALESYQHKKHYKLALALFNMLCGYEQDKQTVPELSGNPETFVILARQIRQLSRRVAELEEAEQVKALTSAESEPPKASIRMF